MRTIYKYKVATEDRVEIQTHRGAQLLSVQDQNDGLRLTYWFLVDTSEPIVPHTFAVFGTGRPVDVEDEDMFHVATVQQLRGSLVWHVFEMFVPD
jgi:hypothetical protein